MRRLIPRLLLGLLVLFILIQFVPYGRDHENPPVVQEPTWDSAETRALAARACFDCHSNETKWQWYHNIAPISWGVQMDVENGRAEMNFSEWHREQDKADDAPEEVREGNMPLPQYLIVHPEARLTDAERDQLARGLIETFRISGVGGGEFDSDFDDVDDDDD